MANWFLMYYNKAEPYAPTVKLHNMVFFRCVFGTLAHFCYYLAISIMQLSDAVAIFLTTPIWTTLMASVILKEKMKSAIFISIIVSFFGILLIVKPPFLFSMILDMPVPASGGVSLAGITVCFVFSFFESATNLVIKGIGKQMNVLSVIQYVYTAGVMFNGLLLQY